MIPPALTFCTVQGAVLRVAPLVVVGQDFTPDTVRTRPYSFADLCGRWGVGIDAVEMAVGSRFFTIGRKKFVRPAVVLRIEELREVGR